MPTYEYTCAKCKKSFEVFQSMKDAPLAVCPKDQCRQKKWGKGKVKRLLGAGAGIIFKGSGFYITDYRSNSYKEAAKKDKPSETKPDGVSKPSSESKPAAAKDSKPAKPKTAPAS